MTEEKTEQQAEKISDLVALKFESEEPWARLGRVKLTEKNFLEHVDAIDLEERKWTPKKEKFKIGIGCSTYHCRNKTELVIGIFNTNDPEEMGAMEKTIKMIILDRTFAFYLS